MMTTMPSPNGDIVEELDVLVLGEGPNAIPHDVMYPVTPLPRITTSEVTLRYQKLHESARIERDRENAGYDIWATVPSFTAMPGRNLMLPTGLRFDIPKDHVLIIKGRSSLASRGLCVAGGVIDWSYTGEVEVCLHNVVDYAVHINTDNAIAQFLLFYAPYVPLEEVDEITNNSNRGSKGFGSTDGCAE